MDNENSRISAWKNLAELFLKENKRVYLKDFNDDYYFADILLVGEQTILIKCFAPSDRKDKKITLYWAAIKRFAEYKEEM